MKLYLLWRKLLPPVFIVVFVHFLKDITQDILHISTPLDLLGDVKEDLFGYPAIIQTLVILLGYASFIGEAFLLIAIPIIMKKNKPSVLEKAVIITLVAMSIYFIAVVLLDPRYKLG